MGTVLVPFETPICGQPVCVGIFLFLQNCDSERAAKKFCFSHLTEMGRF
jgi:hypothetical protein